MNVAEIKTWALEIVEAVMSGKPAEDSRVECKAFWMDANGIARQFAGHANAAKGESILWLVGVDDKAGVITGADRKELANWYPQLVREFESVAPCLTTDVNIEVAGKTVVALLFETSNAPFIVKVPGTDRLEIPWRQGTRTRSATRAEILRIFGVLQNQGALSSINALIQESPRAQNLAIERPLAWEYLLTIELIKTKLQRSRRRYDEVCAGRVHTRTRMVSGKDFARIVREKMSDLESWTKVLTAWVDVDLPNAWGAPGEPGEPIEIKQAADRFIAAANELVEWETEIVSLKPPEMFETTMSLLRGLTSRLFEEMERFVQLFSEPFEHGLPPSGTVININLVLDFAAGKIDQIGVEMNRISSLIEDDPEGWLAQWNEV
jgi:hypothetical protein